MLIAMMEENITFWGGFFQNLIFEWRLLFQARSHFWCEDTFALLLILDLHVICCTKCACLVYTFGKFSLCPLCQFIGQQYSIAGQVQCSSVSACSSVTLHEVESHGDSIHGYWPSVLVVSMSNNTAAAACHGLWHSIPLAVQGVLW